MLIKKKERIGILGGSFDPPHKGHLKISKISLKKIGLKEIYWCLTKKNPLKSKSFYSVKERKLKSKKILGKYKKIKLLYLDDKIKSSRTVNLVDYFIKKKKLKNLYLIMGSDNLINFHRWKSWKKVVKAVKLVVFSRRGYDKLGERSVVVKYLNKKNIIFINNKFIDVSSTNIKNKEKQMN
tara:strand:- start:57 stop:599 length:543 start_codon:yes stop_codon:yes gene_type:complete